MYANLGVPVVPVALNSGLFWPRNGLRLYKGTIIMEFLPPIEPGLDPSEFAKLLEETIESRTAELLAEAQADPEFEGSSRFKPVQAG